MKIKIGLQLGALFLGATALSACQSLALKDKDAFGTYDNTTLKTSELTVQEKSSLANAQKQLYETAQRILENHYLDAWFTDYEVKNKFSTLAQAKNDYFAKNISVTENDVNKFLQDNASNKELLQIPASQRAPTVRQYLVKVAQAHAEQKILAEAYKQEKLRLMAYEKPSELVVQFEGGGHIYNPSLKDPKVTIVEFADYQCPFCVKADPEVIKLVSTYKEKVQYIFRDFPLLDKHPQALPAALAAKCSANQGKYWEMHSLIFDRSPMSELNANMYTSFAQKLNLNLNQFKECQNDPSQKESIVSDLNEGLRVGVNETPTIYINGQKFDDYINFDNLKNAVDKLLAQ